MQLRNRIVRKDLVAH